MSNTDKNFKLIRHTRKNIIHPETSHDRPKKKKRNKIKLCQIIDARKRIMKTYSSVRAMQNSKSKALKWQSFTVLKNDQDFQIFLVLGNST